MSEDPAARAEQLKLARLLRVEPERLAGVEHAAAEELRALRAAMTEALFAPHRRSFAGVASLAGRIPPKVAAPLAHRALPPMIAARAAELIEPHHATELVSRPPDDYLADVATSLDPSRAGHLLSALPADRIATVGALLGAREEWVTLGSFLGHITRDALELTVGRLGDEALLRTSFVLEDPARLDDVVSMLDDARLDGLAQTARDLELDDVVDHLLTHLDAEQRARVASRR
jgi:hypothetical protein